MISTFFALKKDVVLEEVNLKTKFSNSDMFVIMVENENSENSEKTYSVYSENIFPQKENGFLFNTELSGCVDDYGNAIDNAMEYRNNLVKLRTNNATYCYLYFDRWSSCVEGGITNLKDCLLVTDTQSYSAMDAMEIIAEKDPIETSMVAPTVNYTTTYTYQESQATSGFVATTHNLLFSEEISFDETRGVYTLVDPVSAVVSDTYIGYYTCGSASAATCSNVYEVKGYRTETLSTGAIRYIIDKANVHTYASGETFESQKGFYKVPDNDGDSYIFRGDVKNNYVYFAGSYWRVIRINGNGSIRMIYAGTTPDATGYDASIGRSYYNETYWAPAAVGYTYDDTWYENEIYAQGYMESSVDNLITISSINQNEVYYFSKEFTITEDGKFQLDSENGKYISGKWSEISNSVLAEDGYTYTCLHTSLGGQCQILYNIKEYVSATKANVTVLSTTSNRYEDTLLNTKNSTIKEFVDSWYELNIAGSKVLDADSNIIDNLDGEGNLIYKLDDENNRYIDYLSDEVFCNDRQVNSGSGYLLAPNTQYMAVKRIGFNKNPTLKCGLANNENANEEDVYSVSNGNLHYPIALITADEVSLAGALTNAVNNSYYLYTGVAYSTMTPNKYESTNSRANMYVVHQDGYLTSGGANGNYSVRPVINLKSSVKITEGIGTSNEPYRLSIAQ